MKKSKNNEEKMRVSFDLDEVLFVYPKTHKTEPELKFPFNKYYKERLRLGTPELINTLQDLGYEVWVYTSSFRSEKYIKGLFKHYGVKFDGIINGNRHLNEVQKNSSQLLPQKVPSRYRISLHIDDEDAIIENGKRYGFRVLRICEPDEHWTDKVLNEAERIRKIEEGN